MTERVSIKTIRQTLLEVAHAQQCGSEWYTKGSQGLYQQVSMWVRRGTEAVKKVEEFRDQVAFVVNHMPMSDEAYKALCDAIAEVDPE